ncbi:MAG: hypothetical protein Q4Q17_04940 [Tissierellia bacterium]|nr:hypothetical protein [Tissierellia bacterium]
MNFSYPIAPIRSFSEDELKQIKNGAFAKVKKDGCLPQGSYLTTPFVEYVKVDGKMLLPTNHILKAAIVKKDGLTCVEPRNLKEGDEVLLGDCPCNDCGIFRDEDAFPSTKIGHGLNTVYEGSTTSYRRLFYLMKEIHERGGKIAWVLGPAVVFDYDTRLALSELADEGYVQALLAGNAMATHDLEGGYLNTALGQNIYTQESVPNGHYNHLDLLNEARHFPDLKSFIVSGEVKDGFVKKMVEKDLPIVLCGSIRDDGPLPPVFSKATEGLAAMTEVLRDADLIITLATLLHSVSAVECAPTYRVEGDQIKGTFVATIDITDYATNSVVNEREGYLVDAIVTNVQDFCVNARNNLIRFKDAEGRLR